MPTPCPLSLIVPYRQRSAHLQILLAWWKDQVSYWPTCELVLVEFDTTPSGWIPAALGNLPIRYCYLPGDGPFPKSRLLNYGLSLCQGKFVAPLDVDLLPLGTTLATHLALAEASPLALISGYRLMADRVPTHPAEVMALADCSTIPPEDQPTALWKNLMRGERFGVVPFFQRSRLVTLGGWDETFVGWGAEDQDMVERYLENNFYLCRCPDLRYLHLHHDPDPNWAEDHWTQQNRRHYYAKLTTRQRSQS